MAGRPSLSIRRRRVALLAGALAVLVAAGALVATGSGPGAATTGGSSSTTTTPPSTGQGTTEPGTTSPTADGTPPSKATVLPAGFTVKAGAPAEQAAGTDTPLVKGKALTKNAVGQILDRLPAFTGQADLGTDFNWPAASLTKPAAGQTITQTFPAAGDGQSPPSIPAPTPTGPLQVLRMQPQGSVSVAPFASITFNQPMIPLSTVGQLKDNQVPAKISPAVLGHWDWIGTTTLRFTAESTTVDRLPMATRFTLTVPAGTTSQSGGTLAKAASATFTTPAPGVQSFTPAAKQVVGLRPVLLAVFNQRVDPATVLKSVTVSAGGKPQSVRLATATEIAADQAASAALSTAPQGRTVVLIPTRDLPADATVIVDVKAGTRSTEGPLPSTHDSNHTFSTYPPLRLTRSSCNDGNCQAGAPLVLSFNNALDTDDFDPSTVTVDPALPGGASISAAGPNIVVSGNTQASTNYRVTVKAGLTDVHGQKLAQPVGNTLRIGAASTALYPFPTAVTTLDPTASKPTVTITTVNQRHFRERVFAVDQSDWGQYGAWYTRLRNNQDGQTEISASLPDWTVLTDRTVDVTGPADALAATAIDLSGELAARKQVVVLIEPIDPLPSDLKWQNEPTTSWVQKTDLSVDATVDQSTMNAWVTDLRTGAPVAGATVSLLDNGGHEVNHATTDAHGLIKVDLTSAHVASLRATQGGDTGLLPGDLYGGSWSRSRTQDSLLWYVIDDRQTYRPGETVSIKGWVRRQAGDSTTALTAPAGDHVTWTAEDASNIHLAGGTVTVDSAGGFDLTVALPAGAHLGDGHVELMLAGAGNVGSAQSYHSFTIADFRTPSFQVDTHAADNDPAIKGAEVAVQADATYYAGGALGDAPVNWQIRTATASYAPPGWSSYTFGVWTPWWYESAGGAAGYGYSNGYASAGPGFGYGYDPNSQNSKVEAITGTTDGAGSSSVDVNVGDLGKDADGLPVTVQAQATVTDVNRQPIADTANLVVHPAAYYVGLASDSTFVKQGDKLTLQAVVTAVDGTVKAGRPVTVTAARVIGDSGYGWDQDESSATLADPQTCTVTSAATPVTCSFTPKLGGEYRITAIVTDEKGRTSRTQLTRWVAGVDGTVATTVQAQTATLVPDRQSYAPGQSAKLLVASPIGTGTGLITLSHNGIVWTDTFAVSGGSAVVTIPITEALVPGVTAFVEVVGAVARAGDPAGGSGTRPAYATGQIDLTVSTVTRALTVSVKPRQAMVKPGGQTTVDVKVTDSSGKAVSGSQFEVVVVDEAVLALSGDQLPDPLTAFYPQQYDGWLNSTFGRATVMLGSTSQKSVNGSIPASAAAASGAASSASSSSAAGGGSETNDAAGAVPAAGGAGYSTGAGTVTTPIAQRTDFDALALFRPSVTTGADGTAAIPVTLPDNLTRYRVQVVAVSGNDRFGAGDATLTAGLTLTVRPTPPRFLNFGDHAELPVVVQNLSDTPRATDVVLQAGNLTVAGSVVDTPKGTQAFGQEVSVPAHGRIEVRFAVAADQAGTARFRVVAVSGADADAAELDIPVYTPSTSETFATYGSVGADSNLDAIGTSLSAAFPYYGYPELASREEFDKFLTWRNMPNATNLMNLGAGYAMETIPLLTYFKKDWLKEPRHTYPTTIPSYLPFARGDMTAVNMGERIWTDWMLWKFKKMLQETPEISGTYNDTAYPEVQEKNGEVFASVFAGRKFHQRIYVLLQRMRGDKARTIYHQGLDTILPYAAYADLVLNGEHLRGELMKNSYYTQFMGLPELRATFASPLGPSHMFLSQYRQPEKNADPKLLAHTGGIALLHDDIIWMVKQETLLNIMREKINFGDLSKATWFPYWQENPFLQTGNEKIVASFYERTGDLFIILFNNSPEKQTADLKLLAPFLKKNSGGQTRVYDPTTNSATTISLGANAAKIELEPWQPKLLTLKK